MSEDYQAPDYRDPSGRYLPISIDSLRLGTAKEFDFYYRTGDDYFLVKPKNMEINEKLLDRYSKTTPYLYIRAQDQEGYFKHLNNNIEEVLKNEQITSRQKAALLTDRAVDIIDRLFTEPGHPETIKETKKVAQNFVSFIGMERHSFLHLVELSNHDHYTYAHSVGVAAYAIVLAKNLGYKRDDMVNIGMAGLLHDIGKVQIAPEIINKKGPLNEDEWKQMKKHPALGGEILRQHKNIDDIIILSAEAHHENYVGTGYPQGLVASKLDPIVNIVSLADAFSALTTKRSYSPQRDSMTAFKLMRENMHTKFDPDLFKKFVMIFLDPKKKVA